MTRPVAVVLTAALLLLAACGRSADARSDEVFVPQLGWADADDREVDLPEGPFLQGEVGEIAEDEPVLINFWASTCAPCRKELPLLQELASEGVTVIGVTRDRFDKYALEALDRAGASYPNLKDAEGDHIAAYDGLVPQVAIPSSALLVDGKVTRVHIGPFHTRADLDEVRDLAAG